jgi:hypothetical protein
MLLILDFLERWGFMKTDLEDLESVNLTYSTAEGSVFPFTSRTILEW